MDDAVAWNDLGVKAEKSGNFKEALKMYDKALSINPDYSKAWSNKGVIYAKLNEYDKAVAAFKKSLEINPNNATAYVNLGGVLIETGKFDDALNCYDKALVLAPDRPEFQQARTWALATIKKKRGRPFSLKKYLSFLFPQSSE